MAYEGLDALGDRTRRAIFERLAEAPRAVGELARELPISRPAVSQHLKVLKEAGLVVDRRAGNRRIYHVDPEGVGALRAYFDRFWNEALTAFKAAAEQPPAKPEPPPAKPEPPPAKPEPPPRDPDQPRANPDQPKEDE